MNNEEWSLGRHVKLRQLFPDLYEMEVGDKKFHIIFEDIFCQINDITSGEVKAPSKEDVKAVIQLFWKFIDKFEIEIGR